MLPKSGFILSIVNPKPNQRNNFDPLQSLVQVSNFGKVILLPVLSINSPLSGMNVVTDKKFYLAATGQSLENSTATFDYGCKNIG